MPLITEVPKGAEISECGKYRYILWRGDIKHAINPMIFIGLNPSTADATLDDPTIRRCWGFTQREGCDCLVMLNLFAFRATEPDDMKKQADPVGPRNDGFLADPCGLVASRLVNPNVKGLVVAAWGTHGNFRGRDLAVRRMLKGHLKCLGKTKDGHPKHPLYLPANAAMIDFG